MKSLLTITFLLISSSLWAQTEPNKSIISVSYTGGFFTHPGFSLGYHWNSSLSDNWEFRPGIKVGAYFHKRYQNAVFVLPEVQLVRSGNKGILFGVSLNAGFQRHFIPNVYVENKPGELIRKKFSGTNHFVFAPGILLGKTFELNSNKKIEIFIHPQFQFRMLHGNSPQYKMGKYALGSILLTYLL